MSTSAIPSKTATRVSLSLIGLVVLSVAYGGGILAAAVVLLALLGTPLFASQTPEDDMPDKQAANANMPRTLRCGPRAGWCSRSRRWRTPPPPAIG